MTDQHIDRYLLNACERGDITQEALTRHVLRHLQGSCETCRRELAVWRKERNPRRHAKPLLQTLLQERVSDPEESQKAERDFLTLFPLTPSQRQRKIARARTRFRSPWLARLLVEEAIEEFRSDLDEASALIEAAFQVLDRAPFSHFKDEVQILTRAALASTHKSRGHLARAERFFIELRDIAQMHGLVDLSLAAQVDELEGNFWRDRRHLDQSRRLLLRAIKLYRLLGDKTRRARALLILGGTHFYAGDSPRAIAVAREAFELDTGRETFRAMAGHNLALYLVESGNLEEGVRCFQDNVPRYRKVRDSWRLCDLYFHWLAGKIHRSLGQLDTAERHLLQARDGFAERGTAYDAILVCLDLGLVYDGQERYDELETLAEHTIHGLTSESLHREAHAALVLFAKAARRRIMSHDLARRIAHFLQFSFHNPELRCEIQLPEAD